MFSQWLRLNPRPCHRRRARGDSERDEAPADGARRAVLLRPRRPAQHRAPGPLPQQRRPAQHRAPGPPSGPGRCGAFLRVPPLCPQQRRAKECKGRRPDPHRGPPRAVRGARRSGARRRTRTRRTCRRACCRRMCCGSRWRRRRRTTLSTRPCRRRGRRWRWPR